MPSRENQVQPEVFEMVNAIGNSVSLSPSEYSSHRLCLCVAACTHTHTLTDLLSWEQLVESFPLQTPLGEPC